MYRAVIAMGDPRVLRPTHIMIGRDPRFHVVQTFQDGQAALEWLTQNPADLLVLDEYIPPFAGEMLLHTLRSQSIPVDVIMVITASSPFAVAELLRMGIAAYLVKPFTPAHLQRALDTFCRRRETETGSR